MKTIKFIAYLFYRYYSTGPLSDIPYFSTLCALAMLFVLHLFQVLIVFDAMNFIPTDGSQAKVGNFLKMALFLAPIFLFLVFIVKKSELQKMHYDDSQIKRGNIYLIIYIVLSFALVILLTLFKKGKL